MRKQTMTVAVLLLITLAVPVLAQEEDAERRARLYEPLIVKASIKHRVDPRLLWTVAWLETRFQPHLISKAGARGMMQFMPATAKRYGLRNPLNPTQAVDAAARYLRDLQEMFDYRLDLILAGYNAGEGVVQAYRTGRRLRLSNGKVINPRGVKSTIPPYRETVNYVKTGAQVFDKLVRTQYFSARRLQRLRNVSGPEEEEMKALASVGLEDTPEEIVDLKKGGVYPVRKGGNYSARKGGVYPVRKGSIYPVEKKTSIPVGNSATRSLYIN